MKLNIGQKLREKFNIKSGVEVNDIFSDIEGYDDIKEVLNLSLLSDQALAMIIAGPPGTGKSTMMKNIKKAYPKHSVWFDGSSKLITAAGIRDFLFENKDMKILIIDELSRMSPAHQEIFLNLIQFGTITDTKSGTGYRNVEFKGLKIYATSNNIENLIAPLRSRLDEYELPPYTYEQFRNIGFMIYQDYPNKELVFNAIEAVWNILKSRDIRELEKVMKLAINNKMELDKVIATKLKYKPRKKIPID